MLKQQTTPSGTPLSFRVYAGFAEKDCSGIVSLFPKNVKLIKLYTIVAETKYIFVTGGVASSLGKGIISSSIGKPCRHADIT